MLRFRFVLVFIACCFCRSFKSQSKHKPQTQKRPEIGIALNCLPEAARHLRTVYIMRCIDGYLPQPRPGEPVCSLSCPVIRCLIPVVLQVATAMVGPCEFGVLIGHSLLMLERVIKDVYLPLADPDAYSHLDPVKGDRMSRSGSHTSRTSYSQSAKVPRSRSHSRVVPSSGTGPVPQTPGALSGAPSTGAPTGASGQGQQSGAGAAGDAKDKDKDHGVLGEDITDNVRNEFTINLQKFASQLTHTIQQVHFLTLSQRVVDVHVCR